MCIRDSLHTECFRGDGFERLLLGLHDVGQGRVTRFVEPQVGGHYGRQRDLDGFQPAVDFTGHRCFAVGHNNLRGEGGLRPVHQRCEHLAGLVGVIVNGLLAAQDDLRLFFLADGLEQLGDGQGLQFGVALDQDGACLLYTSRCV